MEKRDKIYKRDNGKRKYRQKNDSGIFNFIGPKLNYGKYKRS